MGRYYNGDINGKFWFAVQNSNDANHFGVRGIYFLHSDGKKLYEEAEYYDGLEYYFGEEHLSGVITKLNDIADQLGSYKAELDKFFKENNGYNDEMIVEQTKIPADEVGRALVLYARHGLGKEIRDCIIQCGQCAFDAEL